MSMTMRVVSSPQPQVRPTSESGERMRSRRRAWPVALCADDLILISNVPTGGRARLPLSFLKVLWLAVCAMHYREEGRAREPLKRPYYAALGTFRRHSHSIFEVDSRRLTRQFPSENV